MYPINSRVFNFHNSTKSTPIPHTTCTRKQHNGVHGSVFSSDFWYAMGTSMAVNYANLFMSDFERKMLQSYFERTGCKPKLWLRFIDDVFFIWEGDEDSLKQFLHFCDTFSNERKMKSNIRFTYSYSTNSVNFLDITVSISANGDLSTELYAKPTASHQYLHQSSYHDSNLIKALPKSQFIRIRRICSTLRLYWKHAELFIKFFAKRGYNGARLRQVAEEISRSDRSQFLTKSKRDSNNRVPLVVTFSHKFREFSKILHQNYKAMIQNTPGMKNIFPEPPMVAYRRNANLKDVLVRARHWKAPAKKTTGRHSDHLHPTRETKIDRFMNNKSNLVNSRNGRSCHVAGGSSKDKNIIYAVECTKCRLLYVGYTTDQLNHRMNRHRSDIRHYPERCELAKHFHDNDCDFERDIQVTILEHVKGSEYKLKRQEDKWMKRLGSQHPTGMNISVSEFGYIFSSLFD